MNEDKEKEGYSMTTTTINYNEKIFLRELEESLKEMQEMKSKKSKKSKKPSWHDLFILEEE